MTAMDKALAKARAYAANDNHGYELGYHSAAAMKVGTDCSGLVRYYVACMEGRSVDQLPDFSTRSEKRVLSARGWQLLPFSLGALRRGDVLLSNSRGHTVIWLGNGRILGAEGNWDGRRGDGSGREVCERDYYTYGYETILRAPAKYRTNAAPAKKKEEDVTDNDIKKIIDGVCKRLTTDKAYKDALRSNLVGYCWGTTGKTASHLADRKRSNIYNRLATIFDNVSRGGVCGWGYKNEAVNGDKDAYELLTEVHRMAGEALEALKKG